MEFTKEEVGRLLSVLSEAAEVEGNILSSAVVDSLTYNQWSAVNASFLSLRDSIQELKDKNNS